MTSDKQMMSFKIVINKFEEGGKFKGYSMTNYKENNDYTKSAIQGVLNLKEKKMSFNEKGNLETTSTAQDSTFCYIHASNLTIVKNKNKYIIKGTFKGVFSSGKTCANGTVFLINNDGLFQQKKPVKQTAINNKKENSISSDSIMTSNEKLVINTWDSELKIAIWDGNVEDNDEIAVYVNNQLIKEKIILKKKRFIIKLPSEKNHFNLKIVALNQGNSGINTLNFKLRHAGSNNGYIAKLKTGESFIIDFNKK